MRNSNKISLPSLSSSSSGVVAVVAALFVSAMRGVIPTASAASSISRCSGSFDPRGMTGVATNQIATWHEEYQPFSGKSITTNCGDMAKTTLGVGNDLVVAIDAGEYGNGVRCGSCILVESPIASVVVTVIDKCECGDPGSQMDLSPKAFSILSGGNMGAGKIRVSWRSVSCNINKGNSLHYRFKDGSTQFWLELAVAYNVDPLKTVEVWANDRYYEMKVEPYGYWSFVQTPPPLKTPLSIRLTSTTGQILHDELSSIENSQRTLVAGDKLVQFNPACSVDITRATGDDGEAAEVPLLDESPQPTSSPTLLEPTTANDPKSSASSASSLHHGSSWISSGRWSWRSLVVGDASVYYAPLVVALVGLLAM